MMVGASRSSVIFPHALGPARCALHCRDAEVKFHGSFTDAAAVVFRPNVALIALMDMVPFSSSVSLGLMVRGEF